MNFIVREPLLDASQQLVGYALAWQNNAQNGGMSSDEELQELLEFVASQLQHEETGWLLKDCVLFFEATPVLIASAVMDSLPPRQIAFRLSAADLAEPDTLQRVVALRQRGFGISLMNADALADNSSLLQLVSYIEGHFDSKEFLSKRAICTGVNGDATMIACRPADWQTYDQCVASGLHVFMHNLYLTMRTDKESKGLNPAQMIIVQLMDMVRKNVDVHKLEEVLKRDAALSYKLFRYINSVGFGLGAEIQSLRHAVTMLGYSPLYRWLSLLLGTASTNPQGTVMMQAAIVRGRFAELAGHGILPKNEAENLFVVGMFSMLDRLLGIPMEQILEKVQLSESVSQALLTREGVYGPFLALAEACEPDNGDIAALADSLFLNPRQVNEAHLAALVWAHAIKL